MFQLYSEIHRGSTVKCRICSGSPVKQTCILKKIECLIFRCCSSKGVFEKLHILSFLFLSVQVLQVGIDFEIETCSFVKPSQVVQLTTLNAVANDMSFFFLSYLTCLIVPWILDQVESEIFWKSDLVSWTNCTQRYLQLQASNACNNDWS